ncbi:MAG: universal stress protein [Verrucomicrobiota bacterium]|nr:universal stress protein [Verrucomicrobiota bacterium]
MHILICSDGTDTANKPTRLGGLVAKACKADVTLLGISEGQREDQALRVALEEESKLLAEFGVKPEVVLREGEPIVEILEQTKSTAYDLAIVGARTKHTSGRYWRSHRTYELIKSIAPPVLVASGECETLSKFLVCTGGKRYIDAAIKLTGQIAAAAGASVTLLHVMAEPPAIYADLVRMEEDSDSLLAGGSELGQNLRAQKESLEKLGVKTEVRVRHGIVLDQVFAEIEEGGHDLIVTGSSQARGALQHYIMGDLTRDIVNRSKCPVLVARPGPGMQSGWWSSLKHALFSGGKK